MRKVVLHGAKTARVEYVLQCDSGQGEPLAVGDESPADDRPARREGPQTISPATRLLPHVQLHATAPPYLIFFTISPSWLARAGTVALGIAPSATTSSAEGKARIASRQDGKDGSWRPGSIFGGLWSSVEQPIEEKEGEANDDEEEEEGEGTIKGGRTSLDASEGTADNVGGPRPSDFDSHRTQSAKARLSSLFTDWIAPEASTSGSRIVSAPVAVSNSVDTKRRFSNFPAKERMSMIEVSADEEDEEADLESALERLMVRLRLLSYSIPLKTWSDILVLLRMISA